MICTSGGQLLSSSSGDCVWRLCLETLRLAVFSLVMEPVSVARRHIVAHEGKQDTWDSGMNIGMVKDFNVSKDVIG